MAEPKYLSAEAKLPYCRGCGHALVVRHLSRALERLELPPRSVVLTTDIGCVGLADSLFPYLHTVHTTHGRSTAFATGIALAEAVGEPRGLKPVVLIGDGGAMIGLLHLVHAAQLNVDITVLVHNNFLFGMTGGQHSALTPLDFVTATTPTGNWTPPLDLPALLRAAHAGFLAREYATAPSLDALIAEAIAHPGFALVEVVELCTAYGTRWNQLTGEKLKEIVAGQGYRLGRLDAGPPRPAFRELYREQLTSLPAVKAAEARVEPVAQGSLDTELRIVLAGSAGERVQSSAALFCRAALAAGLYSTQKNDNPVTQGTGFSLAEICLSPCPIEYTGMESPDVVIVVSDDGWKEVEVNGTFARCRADTLLVIDAELPDPPARGRLLRLPLRRLATPKRAALAGLAAWLARTSILPAAAWEAVLGTLEEERRAELSAALQVGWELTTAKNLPT
ncbi:MAG: 2-oxoacid:acceptor oxidoreductase family protein [Acidobacteria bacterium]|nr:2-oxoacid:acceptor oxidoreductase family protein [Acidobacteriota bacterium]